jgi:hypothetical protein
MEVRQSKITTVESGIDVSDPHTLPCCCGADGVDRFIMERTYGLDEGNVKVCPKPNLFTSMH